MENTDKDSKHTHYSRCANCGKYVPKEDLVHHQFCSRECAQVFTRCINCGKFFIGNGDFCSEDCSEQMIDNKNEGLKPSAPTTE